MNRWYVVHTRVQAEEKAAFHLRRQGYDVYLPRYLKRVRHARRTEAKSSPLFPRYLFVGFDIETCRWRSIMSTVGVSHIIANESGPLPVPEDVVAAIQAREGESGYVDLNDARPFRQGDVVLIGGGPFAACPALFECYDDNERVTLLMSILGREIEIHVSSRNVFAA
jgi:transcriptional antiterminator RfaH